MHSFGKLPEMLLEQGRMSEHANKQIKTLEKVMLSMNCME